MTAQQLAASGTEAQIVVEPIGRNTAPALTLAALLATAGGEDGILVAMPADHVITDAEAFGRAVAHAARFAAQGAIVTLGVPPTRADTGYGYIRIGAALGEMGHAIDSFVEKPAAELAQQYVASGEYWWNSGIFVVRASAWLDTLQRLQPDMHAACTGAFLQGRQDGPYFHPDAAAFAAIPSDSIDYAVMEHLARTDGVQGVVVPLVAGWSDLGSWDAVWDAIDKDGDGTPESLTKLNLLHDAVLARCDARDGITDGVVDNPLACAFVPARDLAAKMCANDVDADDCLTKRQLKTIEDFYRGPYDSRGTSVIKGRVFEIGRAHV